MTRTTKCELIVIIRQVHPGHTPVTLIKTKVKHFFLLEKNNSDTLIHCMVNGDFIASRTGLCNAVVFIGRVPGNDVTDLPGCRCHLKTAWLLCIKKGMEKWIAILKKIDPEGIGMEVDLGRKQHSSNESKRLPLFVFVWDTT